MAERIQRKRTKGWKAPEGAVYVGRQTIWGNPFPISQYPPESRSEVIKAYRRWIEARDEDMKRTGRQFKDGPYTVTIQRELRGKDLMCWCPIDKPCHADVLLEIANRVAE